MPFTEHGDAYVAFHEDGFNAILNHLTRQRPSLFNYASPDLAVLDRYANLCLPLDYHPAVDRFNNRVVTPTDYLPLLGHDGPYGLAFSFQITRPRIDFHPSSFITLPPQLAPPLYEQHAALSIQVCAGVGCPEDRILSRIVAEEIEREEARSEPGKEFRAPTGGRNAPEEQPRQRRPLPYRELTCFCLDVVATLRIVRTANHIRPHLTGLEIRDIRPEPLENSIECFLYGSLQLGILPGLRIALEDLIFSLGDYLSIQPTATGGDLPFNPAISEDQVSMTFSLV